MISLKHTHVVVTYFECNVTFKIKVRMLVYCIDCIFVILTFVIEFLFAHGIMQIVAMLSLVTNEMILPY
jgi:predicted metal-binding membrane protein